MQIKQQQKTSKHQLKIIFDEIFWGALQRLLDRTCVNLRSNRFPPIEPGFSDGQTE
jgi:hypothetical protein